jgi:hypothetical protein
MRAVAIAILISTTASLAAAQSGVNPGAGARSGNEIGTGSSLPRSDKSSNISPGDTRSVVAPNLPSPQVGENASVRDYLQAARSALLLGRTGEAQQALEMVETRALDRSVPLFSTNVAVKDPLVDEIEHALHALSTGDRGHATQIIETALPHAP